MFCGENTPVNRHTNKNSVDAHWPFRLVPEELSNGNRRIEAKKKIKRIVGGGCVVGILQPTQMAAGRRIMGDVTSDVHIRVTSVPIPLLRHRQKENLQKH